MGIMIKALFSRNFTRGFSRNFTKGFAHPSGRLEGKVAVITGGASGIGKATVTKFVENGAKVVIADIQNDLGHNTVKELGSSNASFVACDVTKEADISTAIQHSVSTYGKLDIMYNNAGVACQSSPSIVDLDLDKFDRVMAINVRGVMAGIKHASKVMIPQGRGCILCTASVTGIMGGLAQHTYSISKSTVISIVKSASAELSKHGIRVNCISPFAISTPFVMEELRMIYPNVEDKVIVKMLHDNGELKAAKCEENDIANAALYLASDEAKYVSGHNRVVDGGFTTSKSLHFPPPDQVPQL